MSDPLYEYTSNLPYHEREVLLSTLEVAKKALILNCEESKLYSDLCLALWKSIKIEELK